MRQSHAHTNGKHSRHASWGVCCEGSRLRPFISPDVLGLQHCHVRIRDQAAVSCHQQWIESLLLGAIHLQALSILANDVIRAPVWRAVCERVPLTRIALTISGQETWLNDIVCSLSQCSRLEHLKIEAHRYEDWQMHDEPIELPNLQLTSLGSLERVELLGCFPKTA